MEIVKLFLDDRGKKNTFDLALGMKLFRVHTITFTYAFSGREKMGQERIESFEKLETTVL
ncbi:MAG: hypothetical protein HC799_05955 [Limnothrix sp. RL_2_0]|nr:hypothetical protein [Limnothrix sp. RL_2_0]